MLTDIRRTLTIALSRLRMTVGETRIALEAILHAMYANPRKLAPLAIRYRASDLEATLRSMIRQHCKQHERGLCDHDEHFKWRSTGLNIHGDHGDDSDDSDISQGRPPRESKIIASGLQTPEYQLCQT